MAYRGYIPSLTKKPLPYCGGHERQFPIICTKSISSTGDQTDFPQAVGMIAKLGSAVRGFKVGDRVGYMMFTDFCGKSH